MRTLERISPYVSLASLVAIIAAASLHLAGDVAFGTYVKATNILTLVWFLTAPLWLLPKKDEGGVM